MNRGSRGLSTSDMRILRTLLGRYPARYHLAGPERDDLIEQTFQALTSNSDIFFRDPGRKSSRRDDAPDLLQPLDRRSFTMSDTLSFTYCSSWSYV